MSKIFLIPGLGADTRVYNNIELNEHEVTCVDWIEPHQTDTLATYGQKLIYQYRITSGSVVIGNSLGGMIAIEIAKAIPLYKLIPGKTFTSMGFLIKPMFGKMSDADLWLFNDMLKNSSPTFLKWAMNAS